MMPNKAFKKRKQRAKKRAIRRTLTLINTTSDRRCEGCTACCTVLGVQELSKPYYQQCQHLCESGCSIYGTHPLSCQGYLCHWRSGDTTFTEEVRPDKVGLVVDLLPFRIPEVSKANKGWYCMEVFPGAADTEPALNLMRKLIERFPVLVFRHGKPEEFTLFEFPELGAHTRQLLV